MELVKVSDKGQIVIPKEIRDGLKISAGDRLIVMRQQGVIIFKKVEIPTIKEQFLVLSGKMGTDAKRAGVQKEDVEKEIKAYRKGK